MQTLEFVFWLISQFEGKSTAMWDKIIWTKSISRDYGVDDGVEAKVLGHNYSC